MPDASGEMKQVNWEVWTYGKVKIIVDEHSQTSFMAGAPEVAADNAPGDNDKPADKAAGTPDTQTAPGEEKPAEKKPAVDKPADEKPPEDTPPPKVKHKAVFDK
jgi:hypothetical protein